MTKSSDEIAGFYRSSEISLTYLGCGADCLLTGTLDQRWFLHDCATECRQTVQTTHHIGN